MSISPSVPTLARLRDEETRDLVSGRNDRRERLPGEPGIWLCLLGEMAVFAVLFVLYCNAKGTDPAGFRSAQAHVDPVMGLVDTLLLMASSLAMAMGLQKSREDRIGGTINALVITLTCGLGFAINKFREWHTLMASGYHPTTDGFFSYFFILTGIHMFHVIAGMIITVGMIMLVRRRKITANHASLLEGGACFWHLVDLLWVVLFALLYLAR